MRILNKPFISVNCSLKKRGAITRYFAEMADYAREYAASKGRKVWMDGRLDLFGDDMTLGTNDAVQGKAGWRDFLDKYNPDLFILDNKDVLIEHLLKTNKCSYIYLDKYHSALQCS